MNLCDPPGRSENLQVTLDLAVVSLYSGMTAALRFACFYVLCFLFFGDLNAQETGRAEKLLLYGERLIHSDPGKAQATTVIAMRMAKRERNLPIYGRAVNQLAMLSITSKQNYDSALVWTNEAIQVLKNGVRDSTLARIYFNAAEFYNLHNDQVELPVQYYKQAIKIWVPLIGEDAREVANCYHGLGDIYKYHKFDFQEAENSYEKALRIREKIKLSDTLTLYRNYYSLAATNRSQRDFEKALSYGAVALALSTKLSLSRQENCHGMVANIYRDMRDYDMAKVHYQRALEFNSKTEDLIGRAWHYQCLGETMSNDSSFHEALSYFVKAEHLYQTTAKKDVRLYINMLIAMSGTYSLLGDKKNFLLTTRKVFRELALEGKLKSREAAQGFLVIADHHGRLKRYDSALFYCQKSLQAAVPGFESSKPGDHPTEQSIGSLFFVGKILTKKASYLQKVMETTPRDGYARYRLECLLLTERLLSKQRNTLDMEDAKWAFLDANYDVYENIVSTLFEGSKAFSRDSVFAKAYHYIERSKARSMAEALSQAELTNRIGTEDSLLRNLADLNREIAKTENSINNLSRADHQQPNVGSLRKELVALDRKLQLCKSIIDQKYPGYFDVKYGSSVPPLALIQRIMTERNQVMLEFFWGSEWVYGLGISANSVSFIRIGKPDSIGKHIDTLLRHFNGEYASTSKEGYKLFTTASGKLYDFLVTPFHALISHGKKIQIIPDGPINQLPFEVLISDLPVKKEVDYRSLPYALRSHSIGYAYSSAMLLPKAHRAVRRPSLLAIGFTGGQRMRAREPDNEKLEGIAGAEKELEALARRFKHGKFLVANEATESNFKLLSSDFDIIHLAVHGKGDVKTNFSASLYFRAKSDSIDDGEFHSYELYGLKLNAVMAVLSACESGLGKGYKGEGMISMASAFASAGCENTLMSLWKVDDQASTALMDNFYRHLLDGADIDDGLRKSKLDYLESSDELTADPKTWAPLVAYGSLHQVFKKDLTNLYVIIAAVIALVVLSASWWRSTAKETR